MVAEPWPLPVTTPDASIVATDVLLDDHIPPGTSEAKFVVGHGQLKPEDLEMRILQFKEGEYDVLVSSTIIENYLTKGKEVAIEGKLTSRSWEDKEGIKRYTTEVVCNELLMLGGK